MEAQLKTEINDYLVSTVFVKELTQWETMIFSKNRDGYAIGLQWRYPSYVEAEIDHKNIVEKIRTENLVIEYMSNQLS